MLRSAGRRSIEPKVISPTDPAARYTASANSVAGYAYSDNYLIDLEGYAVIMDVLEATTTIFARPKSARPKQCSTARLEQFDVTPSRLVADGGLRCPASAPLRQWAVLL